MKAQTGQNLVVLTDQSQKRDVSSILCPVISDGKCQTHTLISSPSNKFTIVSWAGKVIRR